MPVWQWLNAMSAKIVQRSEPEKKSKWHASVSAANPNSFCNYSDSESIAGLSGCSGSISTGESENDSPGDASRGRVSLRRASGTSGGPEHVPKCSKSSATSHLPAVETLEKCSPMRNPSHLQIPRKTKGLGRHRPLPGEEPLPEAIGLSW